jgi:hypothetical protein
VLFNRPGISYIYCNIHPQMNAVIITVATPFFTVSAQDGTFSIKNVPLGNYEFHVWHERSDAEQLSAQARLISVDSAVTDLSSIRLDEAGYIPEMHRNKYGEEYDKERRAPLYRRP